MCLAEQTDQLRPRFKNVGQVVIMVLTLFQNMGKEEGKVAGPQCDNLSFILIRVCLLVICIFVCFCLLLFVCLFIFLCFSFEGNNHHMDGIMYYITCLVILTVVCSM